jgi:hypothetical protein
LAKIRFKGGSSRDLVSAYKEAFERIRLSEQAEMEKEDEMQIDAADIDADDTEHDNDLA